MEESCSTNGSTGEKRRKDEKLVTLLEEKHKCAA